MKKNKLLIASAVLLMMTFGFVAKEVFFEGKGSENKIPEFEVVEKKAVQVEEQGYFLGMFGGKYVDVKIDGGTVMFEYLPELEEKIKKLTEEDFIEFIYAETDEIKGKTIVSLDILKDDQKELDAQKKKEDEEREAKERENADVTGIFAKLAIEQVEDKKNVKFVIYNDNPVEKTLKFPTGQTFEMVIKDKDDKVVYTYSNNFSFSQSETKIKIDANGKHTFEDLVKPLKNGKYTLEIWLTSSNSKDLKVVKEITETENKEESKEAVVVVNTKNGTKQVKAKKESFDGEMEWYVLEGAKYSGSNLTAQNFKTNISLSQKSDVKEERWAVAELLKEEGKMQELENTLATDEFVFYVERPGGNIHEIAVKNINGTLYRFETVYNMAWTNSRYELEAMVETIQ